MNCARELRSCSDHASTELSIGTHDLRHFMASALIAGGASVKQVQTVLGHSSAVITLRTYAHLWPGDEDRTRAVMDATLDVLGTGCGPADLEAHVSAGQEA
jgi:site-specific recombinase XerD